MGEWSNATYVNYGDLDDIENAITALFAEEGMKPTPRPPERTEMIYRPMQYYRAAANDLWAVALLPGREGWTTVRTAPFDLLCERATGAEQIRLASLAKSLDCNALTYNMRDTTQGLLIEALRTGEYTLAGFVENPDHSAPTMMYYDESYAGDEHAQEYFRLLDPDAIARPEATEKNREVIKALAKNPYPEYQYWPDHESITLALADALGGPDAEGGSNYILVNILIPNKELHIPGGRALYFRRT